MTLILDDSATKQISLKKKYKRIQQIPPISWDKCTHILILCRSIFWFNFSIQSFLEAVCYYLPCWPSNNWPTCFSNCKNTSFLPFNDPKDFLSDFVLNFENFKFSFGGTILFLILMYPCTQSEAENYSDCPSKFSKWHVLCQHWLVVFNLKMTTHWVSPKGSRPSFCHHHISLWVWCFFGEMQSRFVPNFPFGLMIKNCLHPFCTLLITDMRYFKSFITSLNTTVLAEWCK